ncbi:MAG: hypothetical protein P8X54_05430 [Desulfuromonadales bacterium]
MTAHPPRKPDWLKVRFPAGPNYVRIDRLHREQGLHSVCRSAACPNQGECWEQGTATFMILGNHCTRDCRFCNVAHATPLDVDPQEALKIADAIAELGLRHAVITSVTRGITWKPFRGSIRSPVREPATNARLICSPRRTELHRESLPSPA